ncbi:MAG: hypothetical protein H6621_01190 [Halobacteriovoraceae bacterium]|nr:hypothetical protein [Halobacteriovoraceae bacterium]MCB9093657.1 hypothetical protein [Halobacteriovoraceae bacterium]
MKILIASSFIVYLTTSSLGLARHLEFCQENLIGSRDQEVYDICTDSKLQYSENEDDFPDYLRLEVRRAFDGEQTLYKEYVQVECYEGYYRDRICEYLTLDNETLRVYFMSPYSCGETFYMEDEIPRCVNFTFPDQSYR